VKGCHFIGFEMEIIGSCSDSADPNWEEKAIWVERFSIIESEEKWIGRRSDIRRPERSPTNKERQMESLLNGPPKAVVVRGEFQSSALPKFGHLGKYRYRFILHRVVSISDRSVS
jgi:hypothetical protein